METANNEERPIGCISAVIVAASMLYYDIPAPECEPKDTAEVVDTAVDCAEIVLAAQGAAISEVESGCDSTAYNSATDAAGDKQIRRIMVRQANAICGTDEFSYEDRFSAERSQEIFEVVVIHENPQLDIDRTIDIWNPGCSRDYRERVRNLYEQNLECMIGGVPWTE